MTTATTPRPGIGAWLRSVVDWLDERGKAAWITLMVLGFVLFWPIGLALLFYMIWSNRMSGNSCRRQSRAGFTSLGSTGNSAFDAYKADTLRRLEQEQTQFESFLQRLRDAKDKAEFDAFMQEREKAATDTPGTSTHASADT